MHKLEAKVTIELKAYGDAGPVSKTIVATGDTVDDAAEQAYWQARLCLAAEHATAQARRAGRPIDDVLAQAPSDWREYRDGMRELREARGGSPADVASVA
jgi:hypothetical protein